MGNSLTKCLIAIIESGKEVKLFLILIVVYHKRSVFIHFLQKSLKIRPLTARSSQKLHGILSVCYRKIRKKLLKSPPIVFLLAKRCYFQARVSLKMNLNYR